MQKKKHTCKGKTSGSKKISTPRYASGSIFFAALAKYRCHTPLLRSNPLRYALLGTFWCI
jgi:hypothetical protein